MVRDTFLVLAGVLAMASASQAALFGQFVQTATNQSTNPLVYKGTFDTWVFKLTATGGKNYDALSLNFTSGTGAFINTAFTTYENDAKNPIIFGFTAPDTFFVLPAGATQLSATQVDTANALQSDFTTAGGQILVPGTGVPTTVAAFSVLAGTTLGPFNFLSGSGTSQGGTPDYIFTGCIDCEPHPFAFAINNVIANDPGMVMGTFMTTNGADSWHDFQFLSYTPGFGGSGIGPAVPATFDPSTQKFAWTTLGSAPGTYLWQVSATNLFGTDSGTIRVLITAIPEPATLSLVGLCMFTGYSLVRRRRAA
jgi:hypothetical protein